MTCHHLIAAVLLIGLAAREICLNQSEALRSRQKHVITLEFPRSFLSRHFAGKPMVTLRNVGYSQATLGTHERSIGFKRKGGWIGKEEQVKETDYAKI